LTQSLENVLNIQFELKPVTRPHLEQAAQAAEVINDEDVDDEDTEEVDIDETHIAWDDDLVQKIEEGTRMYMEEEELEETKRNDEEEQERHKDINFQQLLDVQSKLMLVVGRNNESSQQVERFVEVTH